MTKQLLAAGLWFLVGWMLGGMATAFAGLPGWTGLACALALGTAMLFDPLSVFQEQQASRGPSRPRVDPLTEARRANPANTPRRS